MKISSMTLESEVAQLRQQLASLSLLACETLSPSEEEGDWLRVEATYRALLELSPQVIWITNSVGKTIYCNRQWFEYTGQTFAQTRDWGWMDAIHPDDRKRISRSWQRAIETRSQYEDALRYRGRNGEYRWYLSRAVPLIDSGGNLSRWLGVSMDVHDRRMASEAVAAAEERLRFAVDAAGLGLCDFYPYTGQTEWSGKSFEMLGVPPGVAPSMELFTSRIHPADRIKIDQQMEKLLERGNGAEYEVEYRVVHPDGQLRWLLSKGKCFVPDDHSQAGIRLTGMMMDITERKMEEQARLGLTAALQNSPDFIGVTDLKGRITFLNRAGQHLVGLRNDTEAKSKTVYEFLGPGALHVLENEILPTVREGRVWQGEFSLRHFVTGETVLVDSRGFGICDDTGHLVAIATVSRDISDQRRSEEQVRLTQRMESIGRLAGGIAHDFNNLLTVIRGAGEVLEARVGFDPANLKMVDRIREAAEKASDLTAQLLAFARKQVVQPSIFDLNQVVLRALSEWQRIAGDLVTIESRLQEGLWNVKMDAAQVDQILTNLTTNARDAMPQGGTIVVETRNLEILRPTLEHPGVTPGQYVCLTFSDSGKGMDAHTLQHIFEPFFTTKEMGRGAGLGLATVYGIVAQAQGYIYVQSTPGTCTSFTLCLPRNQEPSTAVGFRDSSDSKKVRGSVLVVEDEFSLRTMIASYLRDFGYTVFEASGPAEAMAIAKRHQIELLLTDMVMPGGGGEGLALALGSVDKNLKVIFMSGYAEHTAVEKALNHPAALFLQKPFRFKDLTEKIEEMLGSVRTNQQKVQ
jgi:two-component system, cell cycle sensor histidine kinase and response regulator CckA